MNTQPFTISPIPDDIFAKMQGNHLRSTAPFQEKICGILKFCMSDLMGKRTQVS